MTMKSKRLGGKVLDYQTNYRYLGMNFDRKLNYNDNIKEVMNRVNHKIWILANTRKYLTTNMAIKIYNGMILPYFDYGDVVYMGGNKTMLDKLQRLQVQHLRCLKVEHRHPTDNLHRQTRVNTLCDRRKAHHIWQHSGRWGSLGGCR